LLSYLFCSSKFQKIEFFYFLTSTVQKKIVKKLLLSSQKYGLGIPDPESKSTGFRSRIRNTAEYDSQLYMFLPFTIIYCGKWGKYRPDTLVNDCRQFIRSDKMTIQIITALISEHRSSLALFTSINRSINLHKQSTGTGKNLTGRRGQVFFASTIIF
jgi:hypothetical protein